MAIANEHLNTEPVEIRMSQFSNFEQRLDFNFFLSLFLKTVEKPEKPY